MMSTDAKRSRDESDLDADSDEPVVKKARVDDRPRIPDVYVLVRVDHRDSYKHRDVYIDVIGVYVSKADADAAKRDDMKSIVRDWVLEEEFEGYTTRSSSGKLVTLEDAMDKDLEYLFDLCCTPEYVPVLIEYKMYIRSIDYTDAV